MKPVGAAKITRDLIKASHYAFKRPVSFSAKTYFSDFPVQPPEEVKLFYSLGRQVRLLDSSMIYGPIRHKKLSPLKMDLWLFGIQLSGWFPVGFDLARNIYAVKCEPKNQGIVGYFDIHDTAPPLLAASNFWSWIEVMTAMQYMPAATRSYTQELIERVDPKALTIRGMKKYF